MKESIRIAHISDLHFSHLCLSPSQFFSKRFIGNINLLFSRKKTFQPSQLLSLVDTFKNMGVTHLFITGDLSSTSMDEEFQEAKKFIEFFEKKRICVFTIPGNHDHYTKKAYEKSRFYDFFPSSFSMDLPFNLKDHRVAASKLTNDTWVVLLDCARATSLLLSTGVFSEEIEKNLLSLLDQIPKEDHIILLNHFPLFSNEGPRKELLRAEALQKIVKDHPNIKLYLHGHSHRHCIADIRESGFPIIMDCGSTSHLETGSWNLLEVSREGFLVEAFRKEENAWKCFQTEKGVW